MDGTRAPGGRWNRSVVRIPRAARGLDCGLAHPGAENAHRTRQLPVGSDSASTSDEAGALVAAPAAGAGGAHHARRGGCAARASEGRASDLPPKMAEGRTENAKPFRYPSMESHLKPLLKRDRGEHAPSHEDRVK
jgi:hypothetical protein